ncbi:metallophosphoesterase [Haladaptatus sp. W1]|uniref:metallophosphoesterase family protein n=1 Tax=Haladaptatus sp. W1 TaxID=1897478 RepID=UPI000849A28D|nr:metallophosphoesterase [Haladaptatus sp. W1]ODR79724.1 metallophosphoesterase [Haladaptatus sp. W1]
MIEDGTAAGLRNESHPTEAVSESPSENADAGPLFARFSHPRSATRTTVAVVSDAHVSTEKRGTWKVFHRTRDRLETVIADANAREVDAVVFAGDLTEDGSVADFETVRSLLSDLDAPHVAVPGNHDVPKSFDSHETPPLSSFESAFTPDGFPFHERVGGVDVIGLNSASTPDGTLSDCHDGRISADQLAWLDDTLPKTDAPIVVSHHNLPGLRDETDAHSWRSSFPIRNATDVADVLSEHDVPLHVSGHLHVPAIAETRGVRELVAPSLCSFPQAYLLFEIGPLGTAVRFVPTADPAGTREAYMHAKKDSARSDALAEMTLDRLASLPLEDEPLLVTNRSA